MIVGGLALLGIDVAISVVAEHCGGLTTPTVDHPSHKRRLAHRKVLTYGAVLQRKKAVRRHHSLSNTTPVS